MVSIIVGVYNVTPFLDRGIGMIVNQTYRDFELLLVDDGSTDGSLQKCREWAEKDSRIRVLHQENQGLGSARNLGLENAKGEYIYFVDVDDTMFPNSLEYNVEKMEQLGGDLIVFGYKSVEASSGVATEVRFPETTINSNDELKSAFVDEFVLKVNGFAWNKFYRKSFLDKYKLRFENQRIQQDEVFNLLVYEHLEKAYISPEILHTYYVYEKGNTRSRFIPDRFDIYKSVRRHFEELKEHWHLDDKRLEDYLNRRFYYNVIDCMMFNLTHPQSIWSKDEKKKEMTRIMSDRLTQEAFAYATHHFNGIEQRLYRHACRRQSLLEINFCVALFRMLRNLKKRIR